MVCKHKIPIAKGLTGKLKKNTKNFTKGHLMTFQFSVKTI